MTTSPWCTTTTTLSPRTKPDQPSLPKTAASTRLGTTTWVRWTLNKLIPFTDVPVSFSLFCISLFSFVFHSYGCSLLLFFFSVFFFLFFGNPQMFQWISFPVFALVSVLREFHLYGCFLFFFFRYFVIHSSSQAKWLSVSTFSPKSDQFQISPAASPEILHHTVWRTWLFMAYSDERWLYYQFSLPHSYISLEKVGRMYLLSLRVKGLWSRVTIPLILRKRRLHTNPTTTSPCHPFLSLSSLYLASLQITQTSPRILSGSPMAPWRRDPDASEFWRNGPEGGATTTCAIGRTREIWDSSKYPQSQSMFCC